MAFLDRRSIFSRQDGSRQTVRSAISALGVDDGELGDGAGAFLATAITRIQAGADRLTDSIALFMATGGGA